MFSLPAHELNRRRSRCAGVVKEIRHLPHEFASDCSVCGSTERAILGNQDRYGCPVRVAICMYCGLVYNIDRLTKKSHSDFYEQGFYRRLIDRFKNSNSSVRELQASQVFYATRLADALSGSLEGKGKRLLDVGGSTGIVALEFAKRFRYDPVVVDPSPDEVQGAKNLGLEAHVGTTEDFEPREKFDLILLCRTLEHLHDLGKSLTKLRSWVKETGLFYCDFSDYAEVCRREGPPEATAKTDHCFWLMQETAKNIFRFAGFEIVAINATMSGEQIGYLLRPAPPSDLPRISQEQLESWLRFFRGLTTEWERDSKSRRSWLDALRAYGYKQKKRFLGRAAQIEPVETLRAAAETTLPPVERVSALEE